MALLYALSVLCWWRVGRAVGVAPGIALAGARSSPIPGYVLLFHRLASDALYAAAFALAALLTARLVEWRDVRDERPRSGSALALLVLDPAGQPDPRRARAAVLLLGSRRVAPARRDARGVRRRRGCVPLARSGRVTTPCAPTTSPSFAARATALPLYRAFVVDRIVSPGERRGVAGARARRRSRTSCRASRTARTRSTSTRSSTRGSARMHEDLIGLSDRTWGWDDDYAHLARVGREAVRAHPGAYARGVARDSWRLLWWPVFLPVAEGEAAPRAGRLARLVAAARADRGPADPVRERVGRSSRRRTVASARCGRRRRSTRSTPTTRRTPPISTG